MTNATDNKEYRAGQYVRREITSYGRNRHFRFDPYLGLFEDPEEKQP